MTGFLNIDKAPGRSSAAEVATIKKLTGQRCGHMGTLDPMATGVLPVAVGNSTRLFDRLLEKKKTYVAAFRFGLETDTCDTEGTVLSEGRVPDRQEIEKALSVFAGEIEQEPPKFSAKRVNGRRGYDLARAGEDFSLAPSKVEIFAFSLLRQIAEGEFEFEIECSSGTYIRSLARDLGHAMGTCAAMSALRRTRSGPFEIGSAHPSANLTKENVESFLIPPQDLLDMETVSLSGRDADRMKVGQSVECEEGDGEYKLFLDDEFYGICAACGGFLKVRTKLC